MSNAPVARVMSQPAASFASNVSALSLTDLRAQRRAARGQLELAQLRARQSDDVDEASLAELRNRVELLTDELISRYEASPELIDSVLGDLPTRTGGLS